MNDSWGIPLFMLSLYFFVPIFIAKLVCRASWRRIGIAYGIWVAALLLFGITNSSTWGEAIGWPMIFGMFLTIPAIPVLVIALRAAGVR